ncbi:hypothetical protein ALQ93_102424 [Pseudomonas syringae pv. pisi]|nr:hypothetical protein DND62_19300 [Pseudomonas syringae pv. pisi]RMU69522.1 hypothetical protein ALP24_102911 [Pseudomonas syringae pv. aptata]RMU90098.1 hypothetical protein ALP21_200134 [Pseudomonas savastanoi pv. phaseolicola]PYD28227.1 hypothetical protein DND67_20725 [Pseudomonas syringae pv. pisi]PYD29756.1 hypothetical protein DND58_20155 [Pseudomonas syringae pv. pisi]
MNGWRRLWVVGCMALLLAPVYVYRTYIPSDEKLNRDHQERVEAQLADIRIIEEPVQGSNRLVRDALMQTPVSERLAKIDESNAQHAEFMAKVSKQRPVTVAQLAGAWIVLCGLLYLFGWCIAWVARGFGKGAAA